MAKPVVIQISDTHLMPAGERLYGVLDTEAHLLEALDAVAAAHPDLDVLLLTGDLSNDGGVDVYRRLRAHVDRFVDATGAQLVVALGNHDDRADYREGFLGVERSSTPIDTVLMVDGVRIIALDTTVPGCGYGDIRPEQFDWLRSVLNEPAERGTLLAFHHSPMPELQPYYNLMLLRDPERLADIVRGTDVRLIVTGHMHHAMAGSLGGVPVWTSPVTAYEIDVTGADFVMRGLGTTGYTRIDVTAAGTMHANPVPVRTDRSEVVRRTFEPERWRHIILGP
ncbi:MAG: metallophosphoesterase [Acidimicrobiia bacterium]